MNKISKHHAAVGLARYARGIIICALDPVSFKFRSCEGRTYRMVARRKMVRVKENRGDMVQQEACPTDGEPGVGSLKRRSHYQPFWSEFCNGFAPFRAVNSKRSVFGMQKSNPMSRSILIAMLHRHIRGEWWSRTRTQKPSLGVFNELIITVKDPYAMRLW